MKKMRCGIVAVVLAAGLVALPGSLMSQERRGAQIVITKNDGTVVRGELLAVKGTELLIRDGSTSAGVSVRLTDTSLVKVIKTGKVAKILTGVILGGIAGGGVGYASQSGDHSLCSGINKAAYAAVGAGLGGLLGGGVGVGISSNKKFPISSTNPNSVSLTASKLRPLAKDRN